MKNISIQNASSAEMHLIFQLAKIEGRNPGLNDSEIFHQFDPNGYLIALSGKDIIGSVSAISFDDHYGFIGLHFILPQYLDSGVVEKLLEVAIEKLENRSIALNCYDNQIEYYSSFGFKPHFKIARYQGIADGNIPQMENIDSTIAKPFSMLENYDTKIFPYNRKHILVKWLNQPNSLTLAKINQSRFSGYGLYHPSTIGYRLAPLIADDFETAEHLLSALTGHLEKGTQYFIDLPIENSTAVALSEKMNMKKVFEYNRMYLNAKPEMCIEKIFSFTNYELG